MVLLLVEQKALEISAAWIFDLVRRLTECPWRPSLPWKLLRCFAVDSLVLVTPGSWLPPRMMPVLRDLLGQVVHLQMPEVLQVRQPACSNSAGVFWPG